MISGDFTKINIAAGDGGGQFDSSEHTPSGAQLLLGADKAPASNWVVSRHVSGLIGADISDAHWTRHVLRESLYR